MDVILSEAEIPETKAHVFRSSQYQHSAFISISRAHFPHSNIVLHSHGQFVHAIALVLPCGSFKSYLFHQDAGYME